MDVCEMCARTARRWYLVDENMECQLCPPCARELRSQVLVEDFIA